MKKPKPVEETKVPSKETTQRGELYGKNILYKFSDGSSCLYIQNSRDKKIHEVKLGN